MNQTAQRKIKKKRENVKEIQDNIGAKARSYFFSLKVIKLVNKLYHHNSDLIIERQLLRSATSIGANIIEAQAGSSRKDFTNHMLIALKSANETKYWIELIRDSQTFKTSDLEIALDEVQQISKILGSINVRLRKNKL